MCELMLKDLKIAAENAKDAGISLDFVEKTVEVYENLIKIGSGKKDFSCAFEEKRSRRR